MAHEILSTEDRLLLAAVSPKTHPDDAVSALPGAQSLSFPQLLELANRNRVSGFVGALLQHAPWSTRVGEAALADSRASRMLQVFRAEATCGQIRAIAGALSAVGIESLLYKGVDFHLRWYSDELPRSFSDVDLIVRRADVDRAVVALKGAGYRAPHSAMPLHYYVRFHLHAVYEHPAHPRPLELHWRLDSPYADTLDCVPLLFGRAEPALKLGEGVLRPCSLDSLALMAIHFEKHLGLAATLGSRDERLRAVIDGGGLVWVLDVVRWMQHEGGIDSDIVAARMSELGAQRAVVIALRLAQDLDSSVLPCWARELAERLPYRRPILARLLYPNSQRASGSRERVRAYLFAMLPGLGFRPIRVLQALLPAPRVPGVARSGIATWAVSAVRRAGLAVANLAALAAIRRSRWRGHSR